jgi:large subunit ribosomal protein L10
MGIIYKHMPLTKQKKEEIIANLKEKLSNAVIVVMVNFHGLSVFKVMELRSEIRKAGGSYSVSKKTLFSRAANETDLAIPDGDVLEGETGFACSDENTVEVAQAVANFAKKNKNVIRILGAFYEKAWVGKEVVDKLASIPSREVLLGQLMNVINAPARNLVGVVGAPIRQLATVLAAIGNKK